MEYENGLMIMPTNGEVTTLEPLPAGTLYDAEHNLYIEEVCIYDPDDVGMQYCYYLSNGETVWIEDHKYRS